MSHSGSGSQVSSQDQQNHFKLRIELFQFEKTTIEENLRNYIEKIQRQHCDFLPPDTKILSHHNLMEFMLLGEHTHAPAFDFYHVQLQCSSCFINSWCCRRRQSCTLSGSDQSPTGF